MGVIDTLLRLTGALVWLGAALMLGLGLLQSAPARRFIHRPAVYPYAHALGYRLTGAVLRLARALGRPYRLAAVAPEVVAALRSSSLAEMRQLRDVLLEVDRLPTVERGKQALGIDSIFETFHRPVQRIPSPYTHPLQRPPYLIPGVPSRSFHDPRRYEWVEPLERAFPVIRAELEALLDGDRAGFKAYVDEHQQRIQGWNSFNFFFYGRRVEENCARCPRTAEVLESLPRFERDHIMFSALNPHSHIPPHYGPMNGIVRAHLPLIVPPGCYIKVGDEERTWQEGKVLVFDDSYLHQVWNHGDGFRVVLFLNFWDPCFSAEEIAVLERLRLAYERTPFSRVHEANQRQERAHDIVRTAAA